MNGGRGDGAGQPARMPPRVIAALAALWSVLVAGWLVWIVAGTELRTPAVALAAGLLVAMVWLFGLLILALFLAVSSDE